MKIRAVNARSFVLLLLDVKSKLDKDHYGKNTNIQPC